LHQVGNLFELNVKLRCQNVNGTITVSDYVYIKSTGRMVNEWWIGKDVEGRGHGRII